VLGDAPGHPGGGLGVGGVPVQHARGEVAAEGHFGVRDISPCSMSSMVDR
jgi:hypothetical protein